MDLAASMGFVLWNYLCPSKYLLFPVRRLKSTAEGAGVWRGVLSFLSLIMVRPVKVVH